MTVEFYSQPTSASGGSFRVYTSSRPQNGSGVLSSLVSFLAPIGRFAMRALRGRIGKRVAAKGAEVLTGVAADALRGKRVGESVKKRSLEALSTTNRRPRKKLKQRPKKAVKRAASAFSKSSKKKRITSAKLF